MKDSYRLSRFQFLLFQFKITQMLASSLAVKALRDILVEMKLPLPLSLSLSPSLPLSLSPTFSLFLTWQLLTIIL